MTNMTFVLVVLYYLQCLMIRFSLRHLRNIFLFCTFMETLYLILIHNNSSDSMEFGGVYKIWYKTRNSSCYGEILKSWECRIDQLKEDTCRQH